MVTEERQKPKRETEQSSVFRNNIINVHRQVIQLRGVEFNIESTVKSEPGIVPGSAGSRKANKFRIHHKVLESLKQDIYSKLSDSRIGRLPVMLRSQVVKYVLYNSISIANCPFNIVLFYI